MRLSALRRQLALLQVPYGQVAGPTGRHHDGGAVGTEGDARHRSPVLALAHPEHALVEFDVVDDDLAGLEAHRDDVEGAVALRQAPDGGVPALELVDRCSGLQVPQLEAALLRSKEDLVQIGRGVNDSGDFELGVRKLNLADLFFCLDVPHLGIQ